MPQVMISYRNVDGQREFAANLEKVLSNAGIETWLDVNNIPPMSLWEDEIFQGIIDSDYVVLCLSPEYFESETCLFECYVARGYGKKLLPIVVPHDGDDLHVEQVVTRYDATSGIDSLNYLHYHQRGLLGLELSTEEMNQRLVNAILNPIPLDIDYDVTFSFKASQAKFATKIADDLNNAGIKTFIHTRHIDVGADWRRYSWSASLRAAIHVVILSPDVATSEYIQNEVLVTRTKKDEVFVPVVAEDFANDNEALSTIRSTFAASRNLAVLNEIQWFIPRDGYDALIEKLISGIKASLAKKSK